MEIQGPFQSNVLTPTRRQRILFNDPTINAQVHHSVPLTNRSSDNQKSLFEHSAA